MYVTFTAFFPKTSYQVRIRWANCNNVDYACSADLIDDVLNQFKQNDVTVSDTAINNDSIINVAYNTYNDTVWTLDKELAKMPTTFDVFYRKTDKDPEVITGGQARYDLQNNPVYTQEKPTAWGRRLRVADDNNKYPIEIETQNQEDGTSQIQYIANTASTSGPTQSSGDFTDYCDNTYCYEGVHNFAWKTDNLGYWQVHLFPYVAYFPRDAATGQPNLKAPPMGRKEAFAQKVKSINDPNNVNLKDYRSPYLSDSASSIISISFTDDGSVADPMNKRAYIWLSGSSINSKMQYEHFPTKMFRVESEMDNSVLEAVLQSYSDDDAHAEKMRTLDTRCPGWKTIDVANSKYVFPPKNRSNGRIVQDNTINTGIFTYNNCPCTFIAPYNMTAAQLRKFIFKAVPTCSYAAMQKALSFYNKMKSILTSPVDQKLLNGRINTINQLMAIREKIYATDSKVDWAKNEINCSQSWVDNLP